MSAIHGLSHKALKHFRKEPAALAVYWTYCARRNNEGVAWPSLDGLARDTEWNKNTCQKARKWLVEHGALERKKHYVRPQWRTLPPDELKRKLKLDRTQYFTVTGVVIVEGVAYDMLYFGSSEESDIDQAPRDVLPRRTSTPQDVHSVGRVQDSRELDSIPELDSKEDMSSGDDKPLRPRNEWYDVVKQVLSVEAELNGIYRKMLTGETKHKWAKYNITPALTPAEFVEWSQWYLTVKQRGLPNPQILKDPMKIQSSVIEWRAWKSAGAPAPLSVDEAERQRIAAEHDKAFALIEFDKYRGVS